jgi:hypothetical protein
VLGFRNRREGESLDAAAVLNRHPAHEQIQHILVFRENPAVLQPWHVWALGGNDLAEFKRLVSERIQTMPMGERAEYDIYPSKLRDPRAVRTFRKQIHA